MYLFETRQSASIKRWTKKLTSWAYLYPHKVQRILGFNKATEREDLSLRKSTSLTKSEQQMQENLYPFLQEGTGPHPRLHLYTFAPSICLRLIVSGRRMAENTRNKVPRTPHGFSLTSHLPAFAKCYPSAALGFSWRSLSWRFSGTIHPRRNEFHYFSPTSPTSRLTGSSSLPAAFQRSTLLWNTSTSTPPFSPTTLWAILPC